jgi:transcriptional activator of cad operon
MQKKEERTGLILVLGAWSACPARDVLCRDGQETKIEPKTMEVLVFLASRPGAVVSQREIEATIWPDVVVTSQSLYQSIAQLRKVLGDDARQPHYIETVPRKGYRLVAPVEWRQPTAPAAMSAVASAATVPAPAHAATSSSQSEAYRPAAASIARSGNWQRRHS